MAETSMPARNEDRRGWSGFDRRFGPDRKFDITIISVSVWFLDA
jgi:hypothetical protein